VVCPGDGRGAHRAAPDPAGGAGQGARAVIGILIGAAFVLMSQTLESSGQLFDLHPLVVGWGPTVLLAALTLVLLARAR